LRFYNQSLRNVERERKTGIESIDRGLVAELRAIRDAAETARREKAARERDETLIKVAGIRADARGGGGGANTIKPAQYAGLVQREFNKINDNRKEVRAAEKLAVENKQLTPDGKPDPKAVREILRAQARSLVDTDLAARGVAVLEEKPSAGKGTPEPNKGGASPPRKDQIVGGLTSSGGLNLSGK
jgi:hypothetical protein